jgi:hypothetical protein
LVKSVLCLIGAMTLSVAAHAAQPQPTGSASIGNSSASQAAVPPSNSGPVGITAPQSASCKSLLRWLMAGNNYLAPFWAEKSAYWMLHC